MFIIDFIRNQANPQHVADLM